MDFDELMGAVMRMSVELECLAVAGTHLRATVGAVETDPAIDRSLRDITALILPGADALPVAQRETLAGVIVTMFRQAHDLVQNPERPPGWTFDEPTILQSTGRASMSVSDVLAQVTPQLGDLASRLGRPDGAFLDVGTGAGWLAVGAAGHWPDARVCGIDIHAPALALAATNIADAGVAQRVELRDQDVRRLPDEDAFDLVWLPGPFLPVDVVPDALDACRRALRRGGWLAFGMYGGPDSTLARELADLRTIRSGGHPWDDQDTAALLTEHGFDEVHEVARTWQAPVRLMVGRAP